MVDDFALPEDRVYISEDILNEEYAESFWWYNKFPIFGDVHAGEIIINNKEEIKKPMSRYDWAYS